MNFVMGLPMTFRNYDSIFVIMDRFSKMVHCIPYNKTSDVFIIVKLFFDEIIKLHGLPSSIVCNRDVKFVSNFWNTL